MRTGITVSIVAHIAILTVGLINLGFAEPLKPTVESISVDLVPIEEFSNIRRGQLDSTVVETDTPSAVQSETPAELAQPTGNTQEDQVQPTPAPTRPMPPARTCPAWPPRSMCWSASSSCNRLISVRPRTDLTHIPSRPTLAAPMPG